ncbi:hypothetical protein [Mycobacterium palustre]|uniref:Uncharacterized protein n=1 Tax=Mycobacterium palustre TaxID=153971 RepID=A0A1X1YY51_9MYCO|nr:hypothetical protein [Mycobacterium palustre]MCV7103902.1 hypothetical protein [Mycobacterium palustre]ORW16006.1 hypothetical protein AWC19_22910 [Mycobacterium palustre]
MRRRPGPCDYHAHKRDDPDAREPDELYQPDTLHEPDQLDESCAAYELRDPHEYHEPGASGHCSGDDGIRVTS